MSTSEERYRAEAREELKKLLRHQLVSIAARFGALHARGASKSAIVACLENLEDHQGILPGSFLQLAKEEGIIPA